MTRIYVKVKHKFSQLQWKEILPVGFETILSPVYENDKFKYYAFEGADGKRYTTDELDRWIGIKPLSYVFDKIKAIKP